MLEKNDIRTLILNEPHYHNYFEAKSMDDSYLFLLDCYKLLDEESKAFNQHLTHQKLIHIRNTYINLGSKLQINISCNQRNQLLGLLPTNINTAIEKDLLLMELLQRIEDIENLLFANLDEFVIYKKEAEKVEAVIPAIDQSIKEQESCCSCTLF